MTLQSTRVISSAPVVHLGRGNRVNQYLSVPVELIPQIRYSDDYCTVLFPAAGAQIEGELSGTVLLNQHAALISSIPCTLRYGRGFLTINPALHALFKDIIYNPFLDKGDSPLISGRARKSVSTADIQALGWLYRIFIID